MRVALVHDYLTHFGGAERVLAALMELYPNAPVFTMVYNEENLEMPLDKNRLRLSPLQKLPGARRAHKFFPLALMPLAVEQFDFSEYDVVLSASHSFCKGVLTGSSTLHISYCFTPTRYAWDDSHRYIREFTRNDLIRRVAAPALSYIRLWDYYAAQRVDKYLTLSKFVAKRIKKYYRREAEVIPPPVNVNNFSVSAEDEGYFLIVARLVPYKRIDLAVEACARLGLPLKVVGVGPEMESLKARAGKQTSFLGFVHDEELPMLYRGAKALLFPQQEDFGITPLEAAASGKPTIAYRAGGATETVIEGETGIFFDEQTVDSLARALREFAGRRWDRGAIRRQAEKYRRELFLLRMEEAVHNHWMAYGA